MPILQWLTRDQDVKAAQTVPYRLLEEVPELGHGDRGTSNMLIQGDNLEALKALLPFYAGRVKCIYIDPPYNTKSAFEHYDDNLEHSQWLALMWPRLELLREFLSKDGSIWVSIDDNEAHYLKVVMDEVFARSRFVANIVWQKRTSRENRKAIGSAHDHILVYAMAGAVEWKESRNLLPDGDQGYSNPDGDERGPWRSVPFSAQGFRKNQMYPITTPTGVVLDPPKGRCWGATEPEFIKLRDVERRIYFPKGGEGRPRVKKFQFEETGLVPMTWWPASEFGDNQEAKKEILELFQDADAFDTPKPERLLEKILYIATDEGDVVLDSFLGSGTTAAVAHKTGRKYIGIEMGEHAETYCAPRLRKVVDGEQGGISKPLDWQGGGGFRFHRLGSPIFNEEGRLSADIRFPVLAAHVWFGETGTPWNGQPSTPFLGVHEGRAYALLHDGIAGEAGNVLTRPILRLIRDEIAKATPGFDGPLTVYGERSALAEWDTVLGRMHRAVDGGRMLPWAARKMPGGRVIGLGSTEMLCPLETTSEVVGLLAKAPVLASLIDVVLRHLLSENGKDMTVLRDKCRKAVGSTQTSPVGPWRLESGRLCGVRSAILMSPTSEIGRLPIERKYVGGAVEETVANLAVAASVPELMAACLCLADDIHDPGPCRFAIDTVVANWRRARFLMPSRRCRRSFETAVGHQSDPDTVGRHYSSL